MAIKPPSSTGKSMARSKPGELKATCAALAHLSREYAGQLVAERRQIHRSMLQQPDVMNSIADGDAVTGYGLLCKRTSFQPWLLKDARAQVAA